MAEEDFDDDEEEIPKIDPIPLLPDLFEACRADDAGASGRERAVRREAPALTRISRGGGGCEFRARAEKVKLLLTGEYTTDDGKVTMEGPVPANYRDLTTSWSPLHWCARRAPA